MTPLMKLNTFISWGLAGNQGIILCTGYIGLMFPYSLHPRLCRDYIRSSPTKHQVYRAAGAIWRYRES